MLSLLFFNNAFAAEVDSVSESSQNPIVTMVPFFVVLVAFYVFVIRPQQSKQKKTSEMLASVKAGVMVSTIGGLVGKVISIDDDKGTVILELNKGVEILVYKKAIIDLFDSDVVTSTVCVKKS